MEISGLMGQMPSRLGYQPTMGTELSGLEERIANHVTQTVRSASLRTGAHEVERRSDGSALARQVRCVV